MIKQTKENLGITLIALIITIIVLLILAGVTISSLTKENGILNKADSAKFNSEIAKYKEELNLEILNEEATNLGDRSEKINVTEGDEIKKYIPSFDKGKYEGKLIIRNDKLVYIGQGDKEEYRKAVENDLLEDGELINDEILEEYQPFITEWTVEDNDTIVLPLSTYGYNIYNFQVDYGDGTVVKVTSATDENATHVYENAGTYTVTIKGQCPGFHFSGYTKEGSNEKITKIIQWGNVLKNEGTVVDNGIGIDFKNCINLKGPIPEPTKNSLIKCKDLSFENCKSLDGNIPKNLFKGCSEISLKNTFWGCTSLTGEIPKELFSDCKNSTNFAGCFANCTWIKSIPDDLFANCTEITSFQSCFAGCTSITEIPDNLFENCPKVDNFMSCFNGCTSIIKIPNNLFKNCTKVSNFRETFSNNQNLEIIGNSIFNSEAIVYFYNVFANCSKLKNIPGDLFKNCPNSKSFNNAFWGCTSLAEIPEGLFDNCKNVEDFHATFGGSTNITGNAPKLWERTNVKNSSACFKGCSKLSNYSEIPDTWK